MKKTIHLFPGLLLAGMLSIQAAIPAPDAAARAASGVQDDPFVRGGGNDLPEDNNLPKFVSICIETFSVDLGDVAALYHGQPNDAALYKELTSRVAKGKAKLEHFAVLRARSGERAELKNTSELIYPGSYVPTTDPKETQSAPTSPETAPKPSTPAATPAPEAPPAPVSKGLLVPTDFQTRESGFTLEIEPTIGSDDNIVDLRIKPVFVTLAARSKWGQGDVAAETPVFEVQSLATSNTLNSGAPQLLSTLSRPPTSKVDADSASHVWLSFVTATVVAVPRGR